MGRPRKEEGARVRRNLVKPTADLAPQTREIKLPKWDGKRRGPSLHAISFTSPDGRDWHPLTHDWWNCFRDSSQAMFMTDTDWRALHVAAILHDRICYGVSNTALAQLAAQLMKREGQIGASIEDRIRLGLGHGGEIEEEIVETVFQEEVELGVNYLERINASIAEKDRRKNGLD